MSSGEEYSGLRDEIDEGIRGVLLRELVPDDAPQLHRLIMYNPGHFQSAGETWMLDIARRKDLRRTIASWQEARDEGSNHTFEFGIWQQRAQLVGCLGYCAVTPDVAEIWLWVGAQHIRQGIGSAAVQTVTVQLFRTGYSRVRAMVHRDNIASQRTFLTSGYRAVGGREDYIDYAQQKSQPTPPHTKPVKNTRV